MKNLILPSVLLMGAALFVGACCGAAGSSTKQEQATCLKTKGCPTPKALPVCAPGVEAQELATVMGMAEAQVGKEISARAPLRRAGTMCTLLLCPAGQCCNQCGASLALTGSAKVEHLEPGSLFLYYDRDAPGGVAYSCGGDDSLVCCSVRADGQAIIATGKLKVLGEGTKGKSYGLINARLCVPPVGVETKKAAEPVAPAGTAK